MPSQPLIREKIAAHFADTVNMTAAELEEWLATPESKRVCWKGSDGTRRESVGHASGRRIAEILGKSAAQRDELDYATCARFSVMYGVTGRRRRRTRSLHASVIR